MTEILINNFEYILKVRERVIWGLCAVVICLIACYGFLVERTIANTANLGITQSSLVRENRIVSNLSVHYVVASKNVTFDSALAQGFSEAPVSAFINVPAPVSHGSALTVNTYSDSF